MFLTELSKSKGLDGVRSTAVAKGSVCSLASCAARGRGVCCCRTRLKVKTRASELMSEDVHSYEDGLCL